MKCSHFAAKTLSGGVSWWDTNSNTQDNPATNLT